jgi:hypothetical protein
MAYVGAVVGLDLNQDRIANFIDQAVAAVRLKRSGIARLCAMT